MQRAKQAQDDRSNTGASSSSSSFSPLDSTNSDTYNQLANIQSVNIPKFQNNLHKTKLDAAHPVTQHAVVSGEDQNNQNRKLGSLNLFTFSSRQKYTNISFTKDETPYFIEDSIAVQMSQHDGQAVIVDYCQSNSIERYSGYAKWFIDDITQSLDTTKNKLIVQQPIIAFTMSHENHVPKSTSFDNQTHEYQQLSPVVNSSNSVENATWDVSSTHVPLHTVPSIANSTAVINDCVNVDISNFRTPESMKLPRQQGTIVISPFNRSQSSQAIHIHIPPAHPSNFDRQSNTNVTSIDSQYSESSLPEKLTVQNQEQVNTCRPGYGNILPQPLTSQTQSPSTPLAQAQNTTLKIIPVDPAKDAKSQQKIESSLNPGPAKTNTIRDFKRVRGPRPKRITSSFEKIVFKKNPKDVTLKDATLKDALPTRSTPPAEKQDISIGDDLQPQVSEKLHEMRKTKSDTGLSKKSQDMRKVQSNNAESKDVVGDIPRRSSRLAGKEANREDKPSGSNEQPPTAPSESKSATFETDLSCIKDELSFLEFEPFEENQVPVTPATLKLTLDFSDLASPFSSASFGSISVVDVKASGKQRSANRKLSTQELKDREYDKMLESKAFEYFNESEDLFGILGFNNNELFPQSAQNSLKTEIGEFSEIITNQKAPNTTLNCLSPNIYTQVEEEQVQRHYEDRSGKLRDPCQLADIAFSLRQDEIKKIEKKGLEIEDDYEIYKSSPMMGVYPELEQKNSMESLKPFINDKNISSDSNMSPLTYLSMSLESSQPEAAELNPLVLEMLECENIAVGELRMRNSSLGGIGSFLDREHETEEEVTAEDLERVDHVGKKNGNGNWAGD